MAKDKGLLNREMGDGKSGSVMEDNSHDAGKAGYHRYDVGGVQKDNYRIEDGYKSKDESPSRSEGSSIQEIGHHSVTGELYSGEPDSHGHKGKVAAAYKGGISLSEPSEHKGGGKSKEED